MEAAPPSYEAAMTSDYLDLVVRYVSSTDLCKIAVVCRGWHLAAARQLWGNPASHFGTENDRVYVALTRFKRTLRTARLLVRSMTHTLHLPPAHAELYNGPHTEWLRDMLQSLPNLQSLIVRGLPFLDHGALRALAHTPTESTAAPHPDSAIELPGSQVQSLRLSQSRSLAFGLRLLDTSRCPNLTTSGLADALPRFENLLYLDLSFTYAARDSNVIRSLYNMAGLQVLKMRGVSLADDSLHILATTVGRRVRSLDVRDNHITDGGIRTLLLNCFNERLTEPTTSDSPALLPYLGSEMLNIYQGEEFEGYLWGTFTRNFVSRLAIEDVPTSGLTHLYIAGNSITVEGASRLVRSERLHVLDLAKCTNAIASPRDPAALPSLGIAGEENLLNILSHHAAKNLTFLRIGHGLVTKETAYAMTAGSSTKRVELAGNSVDIGSLAIAEADGNRVVPLMYEMPGVTTPRAEPASDEQYLHSPATGIDAGTSSNIKEPEICRGSIFAPELVESPKSAQGSVNGHAKGSAPPMYDREKKPVQTRKAIRSNFFHPAILPRLTVLILTDVPAVSPDKLISDRLIQLLQSCAEEQWQAEQQARMDYSAPPGRKGQQSALKTAANSIFALQKLVLELSPSQPTSFTKGRAWQHTLTKSMTGDRDSESLWKAAETDFSFFDDDEECGLASFESRTSTSMFTTGEKIAVTGKQSVPAVKPPRFDTVAIIGQFRRERKEAHLRACREAGCNDAFTPGYWAGLVQVVRPINHLRKDEEQDYYGNVFTGGHPCR